MARVTKMLRLLDPEMCMDCRFCTRNVIAVGQDGKENVSIECTRLDCDNWDYSTMEPVREVKEMA